MTAIASAPLTDRAAGKPPLRRTAGFPAAASFLALFFLSVTAHAAPPAVSDRIDWPAFLARHDLVWEQFPPSWNTGGFTGNGQLGLMVYATLPDHRVDFHLGRTDVTDHRKAPNSKTSFGVPGANVHYDFPRLDIGRLALRPAGKIISGTMRQDLWHAEVTGTLVTDLGTLTFRAYTHRDRMLDVIDVASTERLADGRAAPWRWEFRPGNPIAPRRLTHPKDGLDYVTNPPPVVARDADVGTCVQTLLAGGDYATAWLENKTAPDHGTLFVSIANEIPRAGASLPLAVETVRAAAGENPAALRAHWLPKAARVADAYLARLLPGDDGKLHLPPMQSPEYHPPGSTTTALFADSNFNLALLRWLLNTLIATSADATPAPAALARWRQTLADLTPFVTGPDGLMIGRGQALEMSHRHYSHLLALYPLFQLNPDDPADRTLVDKSVVHWHRLEGGKRLAGYSYTGAASLYAALGRGDDAVGMLTTFLNGAPGNAYLSQNTFYFEVGGKNPVIETPLSGAAAVADFLLQSWGGKLRVFPATPAAWADASFRDLRGQGGFLVSARRTAGRTAWVAVQSLAGEPCVVKIADWSAPPVATGARRFTLKQIAPGEFSLDLKKGETVRLSPPGTAPDFTAAPVAPTTGRANFYGVKIGEKIPTTHVWPETLP
ncbi:MAG: hypothetical protein RLZZ15_1586 [Verrucomicrobiota bacterium]